jgi:hypothetical protein
VPTRYAVSVKNLVYNNPGYLDLVQRALKNANDAAKQRGNQTDPDFDEGQTSRGLPTEGQALKIIRDLPTNPTHNQMRRAVVATAMWGYYHRAEIGYQQEVGYVRGLDFGPPPNVPSETDCSAFATWCYMSARAPDPSGVNYNYIGNTRTQVSKGFPVSTVAQLRPGDLVFYNNPDHVAVYVGNGKVVSHGSDPGPSLATVNYRPISAMRWYL